MNKEIEFTIEIEKLKNIFRRTKHIYDDKYENDAEHSWHIAVMAMIFKDYVDFEIDELKVIKMLLVHDLVEIYAGDTYCYDTEGYKTKEKRELNAAKKLFSILPEGKSKIFFDLWREFEDMKTNDSLYANSLDRLCPMLINLYGGGGSWNENIVRREMVEKRGEVLTNISEKFKNILTEILDEAESRGYFHE